MKTFYLTFEVAPTPENEYFEIINREVFAHCWVVADDPITAYTKAIFYIKKYDFKVIKLDTEPAEAHKEDFIGSAVHLEYFSKAREYGYSTIFLPSTTHDDELALDRIVQITTSYDIDLQKILQVDKRLRDTGCCLHFDNNGNCREFINAHSIQRKRSLSIIANEGKVYVPQVDFGSAKPTLLTYKKEGIRKVSTFLGFCKKHDNELFECIDNSPLLPTNKQVFLYAYRSLCRELFVRSNALRSIENQVQSINGNNAITELLAETKEDTAFGLDELEKQKSIYDASLRERAYSEIRYVLFISKQKPNLAFSGLFYPDFDFMGNTLQDLSDLSSERRLITICSAPMQFGWGFLFAWHKSSSNVCVDFMRSLATVAHGGKNLGDLLFRMVISNCENLAISPDWWESLPPHQREQITLRANSMADLMTLTLPNYLMEGLEGIVDWEFETYDSRMY